MERQRLVDLVDDLLDNFTLRSDHLENGVWNPETEMDSSKAQESLKLCFKSQNLADHIRSVKRQLSKVLTGIDTLRETLTSGTLLERHSLDPSRMYRLESVGNHMKQRIQDIMIEYSDKMDECDMLISNTSLAMQTVRTYST